MLRRPTQYDVPQDRRGTATVEFAMVAPLFLLVVLGVAEMSTAIHTYNVMYSAVREGGRLASMDFSSYVTGNQTANEKVIRDIRAVLSAAGLPAEQVTITITEAESTNEFDLSDTGNYLEMFRISASVPFSDVSLFSSNYMTSQVIHADMVYRKGRVQLIE